MARLTIKQILFWGFAIIILVLYNLTPRIDGFDTLYYYLAGDNLWKGQLDCLRTPVYPLLIKVFSVCFGDKGGVIGIVVLQSAVYLLSVISLRNVIHFVIKNRYIQETVALLYVVCIAPGWCNELMTESLSISGCIIMADWVCKYIRKPSWRLMIGIFILTLFLVFLRPSFIFLFAVLPFVWIVLWIRNNKRLSHSISIILTLVSITVYIGYCKSYEKEFGIKTSSISFICNDIYNLKRSDSWDLDKVSNPDSKMILSRIDEQWGGNYDPIYREVSNNHESLSLIQQGCDDMKRNAKSQLLQHQIKTLVGSFDKRFNASVNTHTPLSSVLFFCSLFLSLPLSLFYSMVIVSISALFTYFIRKRKIPLISTTLILFMAAQCFGIVLYASEAIERLLLPVYPVFLILLGIALEKLLKLLLRA